MKANKILSKLLVLITSILILLNSCEKDDKSVPKLTTKEVTEITQTTALSGGDISDDEGEMITERGVCWSIKETPTIDDNKTTNSVDFSIIMTNLEPNTTYYVRAFASNHNGIGYGNTISFKTNKDGTDGDNNSYKSVTIGEQVWMAENLKTSKYNDATDIPLINNKTTWLELTAHGYCWHNDDIKNKDIYGALYNWHAVNSGKLCPTGWHVPTDAEWTILITYLDGEDVAGAKLKEKGTGHWLTPNEGATNATGFTALPSSFRGDDGIFGETGDFGFWWSATEDTGNDYKFAWIRYMRYFYSNVYSTSIDMKLGASVRCVKD